jgi:hypothetical protein
MFIQYDVFFNSLGIMLEIAGFVIILKAVVARKPEGEASLLL